MTGAGARDRRDDGVALEIRRSDGRAGEGDARRPLLLMSTNGSQRPRRVVLGSEEHRELLTKILRERARPGSQHTVETIAGDRKLLMHVRQHHPDEVYLLVGRAVEERILARLGAKLLMDGISVNLVLAEAGDPPVRATSIRLGAHAGISLIAVSDGRVVRVVRRVLDVIGGAALLVALSPLFALVAAAVWLRMGSPVIFAQQRVGQGARRFRLYKFRSMVPDAEDVLRNSPDTWARYVASNYKLQEHEDPRITPLGRILRKTSLDELPQVWNVLRGEMSLVGPRPVVPEEMSEYGPYARMLLRAKPGLTGAWQVGGRSEIEYPERARMELRYVALRSIAEDVCILLRTVPAVIRRRGAL